VGVQTFDASTRAGDTSTRSRHAIIAAKLGFALCRIAIVGCLKLSAIDGSFGLVDAAHRFEAANLAYLLRPGEPVRRGHGGVVVQAGCVSYDERAPVNVAHYNLKGTPRGVAQLFSDSPKVGII